MYFDLNELISEHIAQATPKKLQMFATVTGMGAEGTILLRFDGEEKPSKKQYQRLSGYTPSIGDRVLLMRHSGTVLVVDKVVGVPAPFPKPKPDPPTTEEKLLKIVEDYKPAVVSSATIKVNNLSETSEVRLLTMSGENINENLPTLTAKPVKITLAGLEDTTNIEIGV